MLSITEVRANYTYTLLWFGGCSLYQHMIWDLFSKQAWGLLSYRRLQAKTALNVACISYMLTGLMMIWTKHKWVQWSILTHRQVKCIQTISGWSFYFLHETIVLHFDHNFKIKQMLTSAFRVIKIWKVFIENYNFWFCNILNIKYSTFH